MQNKRKILNIHNIKVIPKEKPIRKHQSEHTLSCAKLNIYILAQEYKIWHSLHLHTFNHSKYYWVGYRDYSF